MPNIGKKSIKRKLITLTLFYTFIICLLVISFFVLRPANNIKINGTAKFDNSEIQGNAEINGNARIRYSTFRKDLNYNGSDLLIESSILNNLRIKTRSFFCWIWMPTVKLKKGTHITGDIFFEKSNGKVVVEDGSYISGQVINGKIVIM